MPRVEPFSLAPVLVEKPWGGHRLAELGKYPGAAFFGESWEVADIPPQVAPHLEDPCSRVTSGQWRGWSLGALAAKLGHDLMGPVPLTVDGRFPLLVKYLDAREHLSVQVHPDVDYVRSHPLARLKTESWYVIDAGPGSVLFLDVDQGVTLQEIEQTAGSVSIVSLLREVPAVTGSFHHLPAGLIHALGAGVMIAEVQTPSDTTFRLYDWAAEYDRPPRPLHPIEAVDSVRLHPKDALNIGPMRPGARARLLVSTPHYWMKEHPAGTIELEDRPGPRIMMAVGGDATLGSLGLPIGATGFIPHSALDTEVETEGICLEVGF